VGGGDRFCLPRFFCSPSDSLSLLLLSLELLEPEPLLLLLLESESLLLLLLLLSSLPLLLLLLLESESESEELEESSLLLPACAAAAAACCAASSLGRFLRISRMRSVRPAAEKTVGGGGFVSSVTECGMPTSGFNKVCCYSIGKCKNAGSKAEGAEACLTTHLPGRWM
jgi:hypothetical protein